MPPPESKELTPFATVRPSMVTVLPGLTSNTRLCKLPSTARLFAPGPLMVTSLSTFSSPLVSVILCPLSDESKLIVSPSFASTSAWRSEPGPLSLVLMTVIVAADAALVLSRIAPAKKRARTATR